MSLPPFSENGVSSSSCLLLDPLFFRYGAAAFDPRVLVGWFEIGRIGFACRRVTESDLPLLSRTLRGMERHP